MSRKTKKASRSSSFTAFEAQVRGAEKRKKALGGAEQSSVAQQQQTFVVIRKKKGSYCTSNPSNVKSHQADPPPFVSLKQSRKHLPFIQRFHKNIGKTRRIFSFLKESSEKIPKMFSFELFTPKTVKRYVCIANFSNI